MKKRIQDSPVKATQHSSNGQEQTLAKQSKISENKFMKKTKKALARAFSSPKVTQSSSKDDVKLLKEMKPVLP